MGQVERMQTARLREGDSEADTITDNHDPVHDTPQTDFHGRP